MSVFKPVFRFKPVYVFGLGFPYIFLKKALCAIWCHSGATFYLLSQFSVIDRF